MSVCEIYLTRISSHWGNQAPYEGKQSTMETTNTTETTNANVEAAIVAPKKSYAFTTEGRDANILARLNSITSETSKLAPSQSVELCVKLSTLDAGDVLPQIHTMKSDLVRHLDYCQTVKRFMAHSINWFVMYRMEEIVRCLGEGMSKADAVKSALEMYPFASCENLHKAEKDARRTKPLKVVAPKQSKEERDMELLAASVA